MKRISLTFAFLLVLSSIACGVMTPMASAPIPTETAEPVNTAVHVTTTPTARPVYLVAGDWNIRDGATEASTKRGELRDGQTVVVLFCRRDGWCRLDTGWYLCGRAVQLAEVCE